jgi:hypothetical protein
MNVVVGLMRVAGAALCHLPSFTPALTSPNRKTLWSKLDRPTLKAHYSCINNNTRKLRDNTSPPSDHTPLSNRLISFSP